MKRRKSFYIALGLIIVPMLIFFILDQAKHHVKLLPYYGERIPPDGVTSKDTIYYTVPDFKLVSQTGDTITQKNFENNIYVANFFFATCKDVCPKMNAKLE